VAIDFTALSTISSVDVEDAFNDGFGQYQTILQAQLIPTADLAAATYHFPIVGSTPVASGATTNFFMASIYFDDADMTATSMTQKLRLRFQVHTNATQPTITFTAGLYPVTFAGGADTIAATLGTVVSGSTVAIASPAASLTTQGNSGDFAIPADGQYALGVVLGAQLTNNAFVQLTAQLQTRSI